MPKFLRDAEFYEDAQGQSEVMKQLGAIARSDARGYRTIQNKITLLRQQTLQDALQSKLIRKPSATIYVLRVQSGAAVSYRLPFFEPLCRHGSLIVFTHCERRRGLQGDAYSTLIEQAETLREEWIQRNCKER